MRKLFDNVAINASRRSVRVQHGGATLVGIAVLATACALTSAVMWAMHLTAKSAGVPDYSKPVTANGGMESAQGVVGQDAVARMFGGSAGSVSTTREIEGVQLQGIVSDKRGTGVALISVDGAPPVRVRVGGRVRDGVTLLEIRERKVILGRSGSTAELILPARTNSPVAAATGKAQGSPAGLPGGSAAPVTGATAGSGSLPASPTAR